MTLRLQSSVVQVMVVMVMSSVVSSVQQYNDDDQSDDYDNSETADYQYNEHTGAGEEDSRPRGSVRGWLFIGYGLVNDYV